MEKMGDEFLNENMCFYSMPPSPARNSNAYEDANSRFIDFEFETSRRFNVNVADADETESPPSPCKQQQHKESLPAMAFADHLFSNGKVMPLLKPPPRFQYSNDDIESSSCLTSPRSPTAVLKFPFARRSLWNDDFDPFMAALENVKDENREKVHRRARSMLPSRALSPRNLENQSEKHKLNSALMKVKANKNGQNGSEDKIPVRLAEPKGVLLARQARQLAKMANEKPPSKEYAGKKKRKKIKRFLLKSASKTMAMGKSSKIHEHEDKPKDESEALPLPKASFTRKLSFRSKGLAQFNEEKRVSQELMQFGPKFFLCMGYGSK